MVGGLGLLAGAVLGALYLNGGVWFLPEKWRLLPPRWACWRCCWSAGRPEQPAVPRP
ncbi:MAG: hypothetical protein R2746_04790 [Acidimicrobiales bacterium]